jgi:glycyl-tRNA synthetase beta chain
MAKRKRTSARRTARGAVAPRAPAVAELLLEIGTEELPPRPLPALAQALGESLYQGLQAAHLTSAKSAGYRIYATPRRLAVRVPAVLLRQPDTIVERRGPAWQAAWNADGKPTEAAVGFARSCGVRPAKLERLENQKGAWLVFRHKQPGVLASKLMPAIVDEALRKLPIPRRMRWADLEAEFIRPVHWAVLLHGRAVIRAEILSVRSGRRSYGHRFHRPRALELRAPQDYPAILQTRGFVIADFEVRKRKIRARLQILSKRTGGKAVIDEGLLNEVTALVEWPEPILASFDRRFLELPPEPLISTMRGNQKCFHLVNRKGALLPYFITVANIKSKDVASVRAGNERVIRARFDDARFFWETDRKTPLLHRVEGLRAVVFHDKLGSVYDKVERVRKLAARIAGEIGGDAQAAERAALLAKADLLSGMVGEFPDLQGVMGRYYALHDGEHAEVAAAIEQHYLPRFAGDRLPSARLGQALAIADRLDTLVGIFAVGEAPSGDKDPYALRRAALGVLRIMIEQNLELAVTTLLESAWRNYPTALQASGLVGRVYDFMMERLRAYYLDRGVSADVFEAVLACRPARPADFDRRLRAVMAFRALPEAESLTTANKRIRNILRQGGDADWDHVSPVLLQDGAEKRLAEQVQALRQRLTPLFDAGEYSEAMRELAALRPQVDEFFDKVMVMVEDEAVRDNRLALLSGLGSLFLRVADLSRLQG